MIQIISSTNRPGARSLEVANIFQGYLNKCGENSEIIDLQKINFSILDGSQYSENQPESITNIKAKLNSARGFVFVVPEYNGSMPGILKYFIDYH